uniref:Uncharacterized protein n=1 Tax=Ananas comosus var. bracteatus TaxID=296719 RepID=A0A6V7P0A6_ANACO|nr:unnamed protein product [Ananas comosus var. bracteatus]
MSTKTLASAGAALLNRFFFSNALHFPSHYHASFLQPRIASSSSLQPFLAKFEILQPPQQGRGGAEAAETLKVSALIDEFSFPCGLPRFDSSLKTEMMLWAMSRCSCFLKELTSLVISSGSRLMVSLHVSRLKADGR